MSMYTFIMYFLSIFLADGVTFIYPYFLQPLFLADEFFLYDGVDNVFSEEDASNPNPFPAVTQESVEQDETSEHILSPSTSPHPHPQNSNLFPPSPTRDSEVTATTGMRVGFFFLTSRTVFH